MYLLLEALQINQWTTLILGYFTIDYQLVRFQLRTKLRTGQITDNQNTMRFKRIAHTVLTSINIKPD